MRIKVGLSEDTKPRISRIEIALPDYTSDSLAIPKEICLLLVHAVTTNWLVGERCQARTDIDLYFFVGWIPVT